jgi:transcriptional regulator with XRE-family HTH domain
MKDQMRVKFGKHVAGLRKAQRMTQQQLAEMAGLKLVTVKNVEAGNFNVPLDVLCRIAVVLGGELKIVLNDSSE